MCDCNNQNLNTSSEIVNLCQGVRVAPVLEDAKQAYFDSLQYDIKKLQADLEEEKEHGARMQELYTCALGYIMKCISEQNIGILDEAVKKLGEIEIKYMKK